MYRKGCLKEMIGNEENERLKKRCRTMQNHICKTERRNEKKKLPIANEV